MKSLQIISIIILIIALACVPMVIKKDSIITLLIMILLYVILATSWNILGGYTPIKRSELLVAILRALRREASPAQATKAVALDDSPIQHLRVLLAEDGLMNQRLAVGLLEKWGHHVTVANNGAEAVEAYQREPFDLILMDVQMPEMDGLEATAKIRQIEQDTGKHVAIVAMTAFDLEYPARLALSFGPDVEVLEPEELRRLIGERARAVAQKYRL